MKDKISDRIKEISAEYKLSQEELGKKDFRFARYHFSLGK
jgi:hypothetical protein